jgi:hypothetical protein
MYLIQGDGTEAEMSVFNDTPKLMKCMSLIVNPKFKIFKEVDAFALTVFLASESTLLIPMIGSLSKTE